MNVLNAIGNIGRDAELRFMADQTPVAGFSFALNSGYGKNAKTTWLECSIFGKRAETLAPMLLKGTQIGITGEFSIREYQDKDGNLKTSPSLRVENVTLLGKKGDKPLAEAKESAKADGFQPQHPTTDMLDTVFEDDVPF